MKLLFKVKLIASIVLALSCSSIFAQVTINVTSTPDDTPVGDDIFIAGNFNSWDPGATDYALTNNGDGTYHITFSPVIGTHEYKFTRGSWTTVEVDDQGQDIANRTFSYTGISQVIDVSISKWKDGGSEAYTAPENVTIIDENFNIPQLNRTRRVWVYLPPDYDSNNKSYPVLYMQDGQNLFDANTSYSQEWEVDESLNELFTNGDEGVIVVGIDNGGEKRIDEYSPWLNSQYGGGEGDAYVNFIVETLKPYIDTNFRTKPDRLNTGIMGSSMGALISFYAAMEHQDVFSKAGIFSPSFWFSDQVYDHVETKGKNYDMNIFLLGGGQESAGLLQDMNNMVTTLYNAGFEESEIKLVTHQEGQHSEWYWRREFPNSYEWLFNARTLSVPSIINANGIKVYPNPFSNSVTVQLATTLEDAQLEIYNVKGVLEYSGSIPLSGEVKIRNLKNGFYILKVIKNDSTVFVQKSLHVVN